MVMRGCFFFLNLRKQYIYRNQHKWLGQLDNAVSHMQQCLHLTHKVMKLNLLYSAPLTPIANWVTITNTHTHTNTQDNSINTPHCFDPVNFLFLLSSSFPPSCPVPGNTGLIKQTADTAHFDFCNCSGPSPLPTLSVCHKSLLFSCFYSLAVSFFIFLYICSPSTLSLPFCETLLSWSVLYRSALSFRQCSLCPLKTTFSCVLFFSLPVNKDGKICPVVQLTVGSLTFMLF